jgi:hypothetical protein
MAAVVKTDKAERLPAEPPLTRSLDTHPARRASCSGLRREPARTATAEHGTALSQAEASLAGPLHGSRVQLCMPDHRIRDLLRLPVSRGNVRNMQVDLGLTAYRTRKRSPLSF